MDFQFKLVHRLFEESQTMRQPVRRPASVAPRLGAMLMLLVLVGLLIERTRNPAMWTWLVGNGGPVGQPATAPLPPPDANAVAAVQPNDEELAALQLDLETVRDRTDLRPVEMPAYWRLLRWSNAHPFAAMQAAARKDVLFTHLWERPKEWRGQLVELKLHVRRVLSYEAGANDQGIKTLYEAWGVTDDSQSFPYVVVFSELPPGLAQGADVRDELTFVGYFLKTMSYQAGDAMRGAPLLLGQVRRNAVAVTGPTAAPPSTGFGQWFIPVCLVCLAISMAFSLRRLLLPARTRQFTRSAPERDPRDASAAADWLEQLEEKPVSPAALPNRELPDVQNQSGKSESQT